VVTEADTLLALAVEYDVPVEALAEANGIDEDDFLQLGQELIIPTTEAETAANPNSGEDSQTEEDTTSGSTTTGQTTTTPNNTTEQTEAAAPAAPPPTPVPSGPPIPELTHAANINPLTGLPVSDPAVLQRRPLLIRVGNDVGARQGQVGLNSADMVYEEITEWWVTRFTAIFLSNAPTTVSPVRSARLVNVQLAPQYQAALAHSGGSDGVRWEISQAPITNLDEFYNAAPYFYRPNEGWQTRLAIDAQAARDYMVRKDLDAPVTQAGFPL
jgi:hypothetical protein